MDNIRDNKGLAYDVSSAFSANILPGSFEVSLQTKNRSANDAVKEILAEIKKIQREPVSDQELNDAKSYLTGSLPLRIDTTSKLAAFLPLMEFYGLGLDYLEKYPNLIRSITAEEVMRVAGKYLDADRYVLIVVGKQEEVKLKY
jgi:zinc protease